jgi:hypothetical protein
MSIGSELYFASQLTRKILRLESTIARLKFKEIDGNLNQWWCMWFNSTKHAKPYHSWNVVKNTSLIFVLEMSLYIDEHCFKAKSK